MIKGHFTSAEPTINACPVLIFSVLPYPARYRSCWLQQGFFFSVRKGGFFIAFCRILTVFLILAIIFSLFPVREDRAKESAAQRLGRTFRHRRQQALRRHESTISIAAGSALGCTGSASPAGVTFFHERYDLLWKGETTK